MSSEGRVGKDTVDSSEVIARKPTASCNPASCADGSSPPSFSCGSKAVSKSRHSGMRTLSIGVASLYTDKTLYKGRPCMGMNCDQLSSLSDGPNNIPNLPCLRMVRDFSDQTPDANDDENPEQRSCATPTYIAVGSHVQLNASGKTQTSY